MVTESVSNGGALCARRSCRRVCAAIKISSPKNAGREVPLWLTLWIDRIPYGCSFEGSSSTKRTPAAVRRQGGRARAHAIRPAVRAGAPAGLAAHQGCVARRGLGPPVRQRVGAEDRDQRSAHRRSATMPAQPRMIETVPRRGYRFIAVPVALPAAPSAAAGAPAGAFGAGAVIRRPCRRARAASAAPGMRPCSGKRALVWVAGEPGIGKTTLIEHFVAGLGDVACARGQCVEHYGTGEPYLPVLEALAELCRRDSAVPALLRAVAPTWLLQLPWLSTAEERDALRRELAGVGPERMLREMGELLDRYTEQPAAAAGDGGPALERPLDDAAHRLHRAAAWRRAPMWLASFRLAEVVALRSSAQRVAARAAAAPPVRGDRARSVLGDRDRRLRGAASPALAARRGLRARAARAHGRRAAVRRVGHERGHGAPADAARPLLPRRDSQTWRCRRTWRPSSTTTSPGSAPSSESLLAAAAVCGVEFRVETLAAALERDGAWVAETCEELAREQRVARRRRGQRNGTMRRSGRTRSGTRCSARCCTSAPRRGGARAAASQGRRRARAGACAGVPVAAAELAMHFERGREPMTALRYYAEAAEAALAEPQPGECMSPHRARTDAARPGAGGRRAQRAGDRARHAAWHGGLPVARRRARSEERLPACLRVAGRHARSIRCAGG